MTQRARLVLGGLALLGIGLGVVLPYAWSQYHLRAAEKALQQYDLEAARDHFKQIVVKWPGNQRVLFLSGQTARRLDDCPEAERLLTEYELRHGETDESRLEWLLLGVQQGDLNGHVPFLQSLVESKHPATPLIQEALAKGFMNVSRWSSMLPYLNALLQRDPANARALLLRGKRSEGIHDLEHALEDYKRVVDLLPDSGEARLRLAETLQQLGRVREASAHYELLRQRQPDNPTILLGLARCRFYAHELDQAEELLGILLREQPDHVEALVEAGRVALSQGRTADAEQRLSRAVSGAPWHREAYRHLHSCLEALGETTRAQACLDNLHDLEASDRQAGQLSLRYRSAPRDATVRFEIASWALGNGRKPEGVRWLFSTLLVDPRHPSAHAALADYFEQGAQPRRGAHHRRLANGEAG